MDCQRYLCVDARGPMDKRVGGCRRVHDSVQLERSNALRKLKEMRSFLKSDTTGKSRYQVIRIIECQKHVQLLDVDMFNGNPLLSELQVAHNYIRDNRERTLSVRRRSRFLECINIFLDTVEKVTKQMGPSKLLLSHILPQKVMTSSNHSYDDENVYEGDDNNTGATTTQYPPLPSTTTYTNNSDINDDAANNLNSTHGDVANNLNSTHGDVVNNLNSNHGDVVNNLNSNHGDVVNNTTTSSINQCNNSLNNTSTQLYIPTNNEWSPCNDQPLVNVNNKYTASYPTTTFELQATISNLRKQLEKKNSKISRLELLLQTYMGRE